MTKPCSICCENDRTPTSSYCRDCKNHRMRTVYNAKRAAERAAVRSSRGPGRNSNACNCGDHTCNGLRCDSVSRYAAGPISNGFTRPPAR